MCNECCIAAALYRVAAVLCVVATVLYHVAAALCGIAVVSLSPSLLKDSETMTASAIQRLSLLSFFMI